MTKKPIIDNLIASSVHTYTLADHPEAMDRVADALGLLGYTQIFLRWQSVNDGVRKFHTPMMAVNQALNAYEGGLWSQFSQSDLKAVVLAGIFQDWKHPQGYSYGDSNNTRTAILGLVETHNELPKHQKVSDEILESVKDIIRETSRPYSKTYKCKVQGSKILRDAWHMWMLRQDMDWKVAQMIGLLNETNGPYKDVSIAHFLAQVDIERTMYQWLTTWGKIKTFNLNLPEQHKQLVAQFTRRIRKDIKGNYFLDTDQPPAPILPKETYEPTIEHHVAGATRRA